MKERITRREFLKLTSLSSIALITPEIKVPCIFFDSGDKKSNKVAVTIDDGWEPNLVEKMYKKCQEHKLIFSAFPVGKTLSQSKSLWKELKSEGV